jgi:phage terminase Nu1 subunit (DNA packaging protein)
MTQAAFGSLVGVSQQAIGKLVERGVLDTSVPGQQMLHTYCSHLREQAAGRAAGGDLDLATERAGLAKEQKDRIAMQNALTRKELAPVALIEAVVSKIGARCAGMFDAIPGAVKRRVPSLTSEEIGNIRAEIGRIRNVAASMSLADLREESDDEEQDDKGVEEYES